MSKKRYFWARIFSAVLALIMTLGFAGCNGGAEDSSSSESSDTSGDEEAAEPHKVGYIFRETIDGDSFASQISQQRTRASNRSSVDTCYIDNVTVSDFEEAVKVLSEAGCTDIVSCSPTYANVLTSVAKKYLNLNFISFGSFTGSINVSAYNESLYQGAYIAGFVAEFNSKASKIGVVADTALPGAVAVVNAVELGAQLNQDGGAEVFAAGAEKDNEIEKAIDTLLAKGCDIIVCYTNSNHSAEYCQKKGVNFIGCLDYSESANEYPNMIMYFYSQRDSYFLAQFKSMKMDMWENDEYIGDMGNGVVNVSEALNAADGTQKLIDAILPPMTSGRARVFKGPLKDTNNNVKYLETDEMTDYQIENMDWYVRGVTIVGNFREQKTNIDSNDFEIKE